MGRTFRVIGSSHPRVIYFFFFTNKIQLSDEVEFAESEGPFKPCNKQTDLLYPQSTYDWLTKKNRACYSKCGQRSAGLASFGSMLEIKFLGPTLDESSKRNFGNTGQ